MGQGSMHLCLEVNTNLSSGKSEASYSVPLGPFLGPAFYKPQIQYLQRQNVDNFKPKSDSPSIIRRFTAYTKVSGNHVNINK